MHRQKLQNIAMRFFCFLLFLVDNEPLEIEQLAIKMSAFDDKSSAGGESVQQATFGECSSLPGVLSLACTRFC